MAAQGSSGPLIQAQGHVRLVRVRLHCWGPEIQRCIGSAFSHINRTGPPTSSFPSTSGSQSLHASPSSSNRAKQHAARRILLFLAGIATLSSSSPLSTRSLCLLSAFPVPAGFQLPVRGIPLKPRRVSCASPTRCIPPRGPVSPTRQPLFELANAALQTLDPSRHSHSV